MDEKRLVMTPIFHLQFPSCDSDSFFLFMGGIVSSILILLIHIDSAVPIWDFDTMKYKI